MQHVRTGAIALLALVTGAFAATPDKRAGPPVPELPSPGPGGFRLPVVVPWPSGTSPAVPEGFRAERFATALDHPRNLHVLANGDVLVAQARTETMGGMPPGVVEVLKQQGVFGTSANIVLLLQATPRGLERRVLLKNLRQPYGLLHADGWLYVACTDALWRYPYQVGDTAVRGSGEKLVEIPVGADNNHWTRNVVSGPDRSLLLTVGAATNINEGGTDPADRAAIWVLQRDGSGKRLYATGLRNPVGLAADPATGRWWTTVNERDGLGDEVPPDYLAEVVEGADYGWPFVYFGTYPDPTHQRLNPERVAAAARTARVPDLALGGHTVPLGLHFYRGSAFPERYRSGAFIARRGGVGRAMPAGFDVIFVPFVDGRPTGAIEPFLTGFVPDARAPQVHGRPVGLAELPDGSLLVADDAGNTLWRIRAASVQ
jgi:glucose/arabinose dehydrogenase